MPVFYAFIRKTESGWSADYHDLPGLASAGSGTDDMGGILREGLSLHLAAMAEDGHAIPSPTPLHLIPREVGVPLLPVEVP